MQCDYIYIYIPMHLYARLNMCIYYEAKLSLNFFIFNQDHFISHHFHSQNYLICIKNTLNEERKSISFFIYLQYRLIYTYIYLY